MHSPRPPYRPVPPQQDDAGELTRPGVRLLLAVLLLLELAALLTSLQREHPSNGWILSNFFSYFTVQTALLVIVLLIALIAQDRLTAGWQFYRGAVTGYAAVTLIVYEFLLAPHPLDFTSDVPDTVMHVLTPIVLVLLWVLIPPERPISYRAATSWLAYPVAYVLYTLLRGRLVGWYPYYFLDPTRPAGYQGVLGSVVMLLLVVAAILLAMARLGRRVGR